CRSSLRTETTWGRWACLRMSSDDGGSFHLDQSPTVHEPGDLDQRHRRVIVSEVRAPGFAEWPQARAIGVEIGDIDREPHNVGRLAARGPHDGQHLIESARELIRETRGLAGRGVFPSRLAGDVEEPSVVRSEDPVVAPY